MEATRTLPASWYYSRRLQDLERRAIFLRSWFLLGPITKFGDDEDVHYEISQVPLVVRKSTESDNNNTVKVYADVSLRKHAFFLLNAYAKRSLGPRGL